MTRRQVMLQGAEQRLEGVVGWAPGRRFTPQRQNPTGTDVRRFDQLGCAILVRMDPVHAKAMVDELRGKTIGGWTVKEFAGHGKSAVVFEAERDGEIGALKVFDRELVERFGADVQRKRLDRELSLRGVEHENLVRILDGGYDDVFKVMFVVMEFVRAKSLSDVLDKVPRDRIWPLIAQVARAAKFLESLELCHRDIKPDNIAVSPDYEHATLLDLGVLRPFGSVAEDAITDNEELVFIGTLQYASPEFIRRVEDDNLEGWRSLSFYQLGAVLHDLIMQRRIFAEARPYARMVSAVETENPEIKADDVPAHLVLLAKNCLLKDPKLRTQLLTWDSFEPPAATADPGLAVKERVRLRMNLAGVGASTQRAWQQQRETTRALRNVLRRVDNAIRNVCTSSDILPPAKFGQGFNAASGEGFVTVQFTPSLRNQLPNNLTFCLRLRLIDPSAAVVRIDGLAALSSEQLNLTDDCGTPMKHVFEGALDDRAIGEQFEGLLMNAFDAALNAPPAEGTRWLFVGDDDSEPVSAS